MNTQPESMSDRPRHGVQLEIVWPDEYPIDIVSIFRVSRVNDLYQILCGHFHQQRAAEAIEDENVTELKLPAMHTRGILLTQSHFNQLLLAMKNVKEKTERGRGEHVDQTLDVSTDDE